MTEMVLLLVLVLVLAGSLLVLGLRHYKLWRELDAREREQSELVRKIAQLKLGLNERGNDHRAAHEAFEKKEAEVVRLREELKSISQQRDNQLAEMNRLEQEMGRRVSFRQQVYKIVCIGIPKTGKTSLTLKWANPLWEIRNVQGTNFDKYTRTVSSVVSPQTGTVVNHQFEVYDFGGEQIVDAHEMLVTSDVHGLLFVVDLGLDESTEVDPERVKAHIRRFGVDALRFFLDSPRITQTCRTVLLFINKSDLIRGTPAEIDAEARRWFKPMIDSFQQFSGNVDFDVIVGSAVSGHNTHQLMPHFIRKMLPSNAYDDQLIQSQRSSSFSDDKPGPAKPGQAAGSEQ